jgi:predicted N-formylglutamate amidohydrolase
VPSRWRPCFGSDPSVLDTHRAWDQRSGGLARVLGEQLDQSPMLGGITRLLVDLNRPADHPRCFSEYSRLLPLEERILLLESYHRPYWARFSERVSEPGRCLHLACHSFTPVLDGRVRRTDIGLLFDPSHGPESLWCRRLIAELRVALPGLRIHANQPYRGVSSGLGQYHRRRFSPDKLLTAELEVNKALLSRPDWPRLEQRLVDALLLHLP